MWLHCHIFYSENGFAACLEALLCLGKCVQALAQLGIHYHIAAFGLKLCHHAIVGLALKVLYLALAVYYQAHCHALHAACRECGLYLLPQHRRELKAHYAVEHAARLLSIHQVDVDGSWIGYGVEYGLLGDFVKHYALRLLGGQSQGLIQVPGYGFSLAVLIGCQPHHVGIGGLFLQGLHKFGLVARYLIDGRKAVGYVNAEIFLEQVAYVTLAR